MLIHGCATGGCHQLDSPQQMRLDRWALDGNGNPELIRRNLQSILAQINPEDPASSPVMLRSRQAHGVRNNAMSRPLASYQAALLQDWLNEAAGVEPAPPGENTEPVAADEPHSADQAAAPQVTPQLQPVAPASIEFKPRDEFDPEIFNRRVATQIAVAEATTAETNEAVVAPDELVPLSADTVPIEQAPAE
jgi:hypothetical protein